MINPVRISYQTVEFGELDIHLCTLRDKQQFSDPDDTAKNLGISSALWPTFSGGNLAVKLSACSLHG